MIDKATILTFGRYAGLKLNCCPPEYIAWMARQTSTSRGPLTGELIALAQSMADETARREAEDARAKVLLAGKPESGRGILYVIETEGDVESFHPELQRRIFPSLDQALDLLLATYPRAADGVRSTPDPEDDRIIVWEVLETGHRRASWAFVGWHFDAEAYDVFQSALPGDDVPLYTIANDYD